MPCQPPFPRPRAGGSCLSVEPYRPGVSRPRVNSAAVSAAADALAAGVAPDPPVLRDAVRALLELLREKAPGRSVEVRVPPYGAIQCVDGPRHTRGIPPNVVETAPHVFLRLGLGVLSWADATASGLVTASGVRADLSALLPLWPPT
jgi:Bacterial SCP ortholog